MRALVHIIIVFGCTLGCQREGTVNRPWHRDLSQVSLALRMYHVDTQAIPTEQQGLDALVVRPDDLDSGVDWQQYLEVPPTDKWGRAYRYAVWHENGIQVFEIRGLGIDGVPSADDSVASFQVNGATIELTEITD